MSANEAKPLGTTKHDESYTKRARRSCWLNLYGAVGRLLLAQTPEQRRKAENDLLTYRDRLVALGVSSEDAP